MRYVVTVRGMLKGDVKEAQKNHDATIAKLSPLSKSMGNLSHHTHLNPQNGREFFSVDVWDNLEGIQKLYSDPNLAVEFGKLFEGQPEVTIWADSGWQAY